MAKKKSQKGSPADRVRAARRRPDKETPESFLANLSERIRDEVLQEYLTHPDTIAEIETDPSDFTNEEISLRQIDEYRGIAFKITNIIYDRTNKKVIVSGHFLVDQPADDPIPASEFSVLAKQFASMPELSEKSFTFYFDIEEEEEPEEEEDEDQEEGEDVEALRKKYGPLLLILKNRTHFEQKVKEYYRRNPAELKEHKVDTTGTDSAGVELKLHSHTIQRDKIIKHVTFVYAVPKKPGSRIDKHAAEPLQKAYEEIGDDAKAEQVFTVDVEIPAKGVAPEVEIPEELKELVAQLETEIEEDGKYFGLDSFQLGRFKLSDIGGPSGVYRAAVSRGNDVVIRKQPDREKKLPAGVPVGYQVDTSEEQIIRYIKTVTQKGKGKGQKEYHYDLCRIIAPEELAMIESIEATDNKVARLLELAKIETELEAQIAAQGKKRLPVELRRALNGYQAIRWILGMSEVRLPRVEAKGSAEPTDDPDEEEEEEPTADTRDNYEILGIAQGASRAELKDAFKKRAKETHPDRHEGDDTEFKKVRAAYEALLDEIHVERTHQPGDFIEGVVTLDNSTKRPRYIIRNTDEIGGKARNTDDTGEIVVDYKSYPTNWEPIQDIYRVRVMQPPAAFARINPNAYLAELIRQPEETLLDQFRNRDGDLDDDAKARRAALDLGLSQSYETAVRENADGEVNLVGFDLELAGDLLGIMEDVDELWGEMERAESPEELQRLESQIEQNIQGFRASVAEKRNKYILEGKAERSGVALSGTPDAQRQELTDAIRKELVELDYLQQLQRDWQNRDRDAAIALTMACMDQAASQQLLRNIHDERAFMRALGEVFRDQVQPFAIEAKKDSDGEPDPMQRDLDARSADSILYITGVKKPHEDKGKIIATSSGEARDKHVMIDTGNKAGVIFEGNIFSGIDRSGDVDWDEIATKLGITRAELDVQRRTMSATESAEAETWRAFIDHHGPTSKDDTCASAILFDLLEEFDLISEDKAIAALVKLKIVKTKKEQQRLQNDPEQRRNAMEAIRGAVDFVTRMDNLVGDEFKDIEVFRRCHRTLAGLHHSIDPRTRQPRIQFDDLVDYFWRHAGENRTGWEELTDDEIRHYPIRKTDGDRRNLWPDQAHHLRNIIQRSEAQIAELESRGFIVQSNYGELVITSREIDNCSLAAGAHAALSLRGAGYLAWTPGEDSFFLTFPGQRMDSTVAELPDARLIRGSMLLKPRHDQEELKFNLETLLNRIGVDVAATTGDLRAYLDQDRRNRALAERIAREKEMIMIQAEPYLHLVARALLKFHGDDAVALAQQADQILAADFGANTELYERARMRFDEVVDEQKAAARSIPTPP